MEEWTTDKEFLDAKDVVDNLSVVNDGAERGVKLSYDFIESARYLQMSINFLAAKVSKLKTKRQNVYFVHFSEKHCAKKIFKPLSGTTFTISLNEIPPLSLTLLLLFIFNPRLPSL